MADEAPPRRLPGRRPGPAEREEMIALYDRLSHDGRKAVQFFVRVVAREEKILPADATLIKMGKH